MKRKHGNYASGAQAERDFLNARIAEGWLGSRSAGSKGVADVWLLNPREECWFVGGGTWFVADPEEHSVTDCIKQPQFMPDLIYFWSVAIQLKSSRALALKAACDWASGKTQRDWRERWERKHKKVMEKTVE